MSDIGRTYHAFWASLLPQSNRQTGFSLRSPTRRSYVEFCRVGFCFRYRLEFDTPNALVEFALLRSDSERIYKSLVRQRKQINEAFGGSLLWLREAQSAEHSWPYPALAWTITCSGLRDLDREAWPAVQSQMIDAMVRLEQAVVPYLPLPEGMVIGQVELTAAQLTVEVISTQPVAHCPGCGSPSDHIHCQYQRTVHDVPCGGRNVVLRLRVRKFVCRSSSCPRKVFAERLPELVQPWARVSNRLLEELKAVGLAASAEVSERLAPRLGMQVKAPTLLRYLRTIPPPPDAPVHVLGIDDFALRRGDCYGTILVNLQTHRPLDLLPDRTADAVLPWLRSHPEIMLVSRDRASAYADAVSRALPHAIQVADRYHLIQNLREHLQRLFDHKRMCLPLVEDSSPKGGQLSAPDTSGATPAGKALVALPESAQAEVCDQPAEAVQLEQPRGASATEEELSCLTYAERKKQISREKRFARVRAGHDFAPNWQGTTGNRA